MKSKVLEKKKIKENKLLLAAFDLFTTNDIHSVTVSDIAKKAGVAKGTFYLYFKDKYEIRDILVSRESRKIFLSAQKKLEENDIRGFEDAIIYLINQILLALKSRPEILNFIQRNLSWGLFSNYIQTAFSDDSMSLKAKFITMADQCNYHFKNPTVTLYMIIELVGSSCYESIVKNQPLPIDEYKNYLFDAIRAILAMGKPDVHAT